ncbi:MAG: hypothetical protein JRK53_08510 [Deltaproteobacteria bacterium]|nr:hypothetical protein [Deltaproteobacteria bacterium]MBW1817213.1 hypothetical protein [Deltaproteobacteria bacterium]MBW2283984.1 hypothetical protein [Deltaproteobacteria bacterium]
MEFCDFSCRCAVRPEAGSLDGSGSCRTFQAVYCEKKKRHVHKNMPCPDKVGRSPKADAGEAPS